jgi:hypothetical protein
MEIIDDVIDQGATFYRVVTLTEPENIALPYDAVTNSKPVVLTNKTPRSTLMTENGAHVTNFPCAIISALAGTIAWTMARAFTGALNPSKKYIYSIDLDDVDNATTDRAASGSITVRRGQVKTP